MLPRKVTWKRAASTKVNEWGGGYDGLDAGGSLPDGVFFRAELCHDRVGIDLLALGKPMGNVFEADHWMYDQIRDGFIDILDGRKYVFN